MPTDIDGDEFAIIQENGLEKVKGDLPNPLRIWARPKMVNYSLSFLGFSHGTIQDNCEKDFLPPHIDRNNTMSESP